MGHHADVQKSITATLELIILSWLSFVFPSLSVHLLTACDLIFYGCFSPYFSDRCSVYNRFQFTCWSNAPKLPWSFSQTHISLNFGHLILYAWGLRF